MPESGSRVNSAPVRLQLSRRKGFDLQAHSLASNGLEAVNVARPSVLGNPFVVGKHGARAECVAWFIGACDGLVTLTMGAEIAALTQTYPYVVKAESQRLRGRNLACWRSLPKPGEPDLCHAAVLLAWINNDTAEAQRAALLPILEAVFPKQARGFTCDEPAGKAVPPISGADHE